jgi:mono/diheme cytochrome c family protein
MLVMALLGSAYSQARAGGWAVISLENLPAGVRSGQSFTVRFTVLQHGVTPLSGLEPMIEVENTATGTRLSFAAQSGTTAGLYEASLTLPEAGEWAWSIAAFTMVQPMPAISVKPGPALPAGSPKPAASGNSPLPQLLVSLAAGLSAVILLAAAFGLRRSAPSRLAPALVVVALLLVVFAGSGVGHTSANESPSFNKPGTQLPVDSGDALFTSKGCITCHTNNRVSIQAEFPINIGPNLSVVSLRADYLRLWLKDPQAVKPSTGMPNLHLSDSEIEALVSFLAQSKSR